MKELLLRRKWLLLIPLAAITAIFITRKRPTEEEFALKLTESTEAIYGLASVQANKVFTLKIGVSSNIRKIYVSEGDTVKRGDRLVDFDDFPSMKTPIAGTVAGIYFKAGESVFPQNRVLTVIDLGDRTLALDLEEQGAILVRKGQKSRVSFESLKEMNFEGSVKAIYPYEGQFRALLTLEKMPPEILPGMTADVAIEVGKGKKGFFVPASAVADGKVNLKRDGKNRRVAVQSSPAANGMVEIQSPEIREGDIVLYQSGKL